MNRDTMIDLYMSGRMSPAREREFLALLERDEDLQRALETERAISGALLRDRSALPHSDPESRERLLGLLAALPSSGGSAHTEGGSIGGSTMLTKGIVAAVAVGSVLIGVAVVRHGNVDEAKRPSAAAVVDTVNRDATISIAPPTANESARATTSGDTRLNDGDIVKQARPAPVASAPVVRVQAPMSDTVGNAARSIGRDASLPLHDSIKSSIDASRERAERQPRAMTSQSADSVRLDVTVDLQNVRRSREPSSPADDAP